MNYIVGFKVSSPTNIITNAKTFSFLPLAKLVHSKIWKWYLEQKISYRPFERLPYSTPLGKVKTTSGRRHIKLELIWFSGLCTMRLGAFYPRLVPGWDVSPGLMTLAPTIKYTGTHLSKNSK